MKKVFLFLVLAFVCTMSITSCKEKEDDVALTDIAVNPTELRLPVNGMQQIKANPVPGNATGVEFVWSSANTDIATVDNNGLVSVKSVGSTTVTVSSGSITKPIPVEGYIPTVPLVNINVIAPGDALKDDIITLPVDDTLRLKPAAVPATATDVSFVWSSDNEDVATVDQEGLVTVTGVGESIITVSSGTISKSIKVIGTIKGLVVHDASGSTSGVATIGDRFQLTAIVDPDETGLLPTWSSNEPNVAEVNGVGIVTIVGTGIATISATIGEHTNSYTVSTASLYDEAYGYWRFDDLDDLGRATKGTDLIIHGTINVVEGPTPFNLAVEGTKGEQNLEWVHQRSPQVEEMTMMWDTRFLGQRNYYALFWNGHESDATFFARWRYQKYKEAGDPRYETEEEKPLLTVGRGSYYYIMELPDGEMSPWLRIVVTGYKAPQGGSYYSTIIDGKRIHEPNYSEATNRFLWNPDISIFFMSDGTGANDGDDTPHPIAAIAAWDRMLTDEEIALLGSVK
jgi:uncharacterized protein YjdB